MKRRIALVLLWLVATPVPALATTGIYSLGYGARSGGMAGATLASGDDALNQIINPANLSLIDKRLDLDLMYLRSNLRFENQGTYGPLVPGLGGTAFENNRDNERGFAGYPFSDNNFFVPALGISYPLAGTSWAFGFQFYGLGGDAARFFLNHPLLGPDQLYRANLVLLSLGPAVAYKVTDQFSVGLAAQVMGARFEFEEPVGFKPEVFALGTAPALGAFGLKNFGDFFKGIGLVDGVGEGKFKSSDIDFGVGGRLGASYTPLPWLTLSAAYQTERHATLAGHARFDFNRQLEEAGFLILTNPNNSPFITAVQNFIRANFGALNQQTVGQTFQALGFDLTKDFRAEFDARVPFALPQQIDAGIAVRPLDKLLVEFDFSWIQWGAVDPFRSFRVKLRNGTNPNVNLILGSDSITFFIPTRWRDQYIYRLGGAYELLPSLTVRGGYSYATNPVQPSGALVTFPAYGFHTLTVGATWRFAEGWDLTGAFERAFEHEVRVQQSNVDAFHSNSRETHEQFTVHVQIGRRF